MISIRISLWCLPNTIFARSFEDVTKRTLPGYEYIQSSSQAFYFIKELPQAEVGDWIIAMHDDVIVGARQWEGVMIDVPAMGYDNEVYSTEYLRDGDIPSLMLYNEDTGEMKQLHGLVPGFSNNEIFILDTLTTDDYIIPGEITLDKAYPNPFNPVTNISFSLPDRMFIELNILDIQGRLVEKVVSGSYDRGSNHVLIDGNHLSSGLYFIQLVSAQDVQYTKILLLK